MSVESNEHRREASSLLTCHSIVLSFHLSVASERLKPDPETATALRWFDGLGNVAAELSHWGGPKNI